MRLRNNPEAINILKAHPEHVIVEPSAYKGRWHEVFQNDHPIHIEIGMGKGDFIIESAKRYPEINFIGIEMFSTVLLKAYNKRKDLDLPNLMFVKEDAANLLEDFEENEIDRIYLNFSDPWPKKRHEKRRLTYESFLQEYKHILKPHEHLIFKTDNRKLFEYSIVSFTRFNCHIHDVCLDLHNSEGYEDNIQTEYERKFSPFGPIYRIDISFHKNKPIHIKNERGES